MVKSIANFIKTLTGNTIANAFGIRLGRWGSSGDGETTYGTLPNGSTLTTKHSEGWEFQVPSFNLRIDEGWES